jgi:hypothetical protein
MTVPEERIGYSSADKAEGELAEEPGAPGGGPRRQETRVGEVLERATAWARRVVTDGMRILHDPDGRLAALAAAATRDRT